MEKVGFGDQYCGTSDLLSTVDYVDTKGVDYLSVYVVSVGSGDEDFAFVVVDEESADHF